MNGEHIALLGLAVTLLGTLVVSTWRFSSLATKLLSAVQRLEEKDKAQDAQIQLVNEIPAMKVTLDTATKHLSLVPQIMSRLSVVETQQKHSTEMRRLQFRSRPDTEDDE